MAFERIKSELEIMNQRWVGPDRGGPLLATPSEFFSLVYFWFVTVLLSTTTLAGGTIPASTEYVLAYGLALPIIVIFLLILNPTVGAMMSIFTYVALLFIPISFGVPKSPHFVQIYYLVIVILPAALGIWHWKVQTAGAALLVVSSVIYFSPLPLVGRVSAIALVSVGALISVLLAFVLSTRRLRNIESVKLLESVQSELDAKSVWPSAIVQYLVVGLLFMFDSLHSSGLHTLPNSAKIYALITITLSSILLLGFKPAFRSIIVVFNTLILTVLVCLSLRQGWDIYHAVGARWAVPFPLVLIAFSTVGVPWALSYQVLLAWGITLVGLNTYLNSVGLSLGTISTEGLQVILETYFHESTILIAGVASSVFVARLVREHRLINFSRFMSAKQLSPEGAEGAGDFKADGPDYLPFVSESGFQQMRLRRIIWHLLFVGGMTCLLVLFFAPGTGIFFGCASAFLLLWVGLYWASTRKWSSELQWFLCSLLAMLIYLMPSGAALFSDVPDFLKFVVPLGYLLLLSCVPWRVVEMIPLLSVGGVVSFKVFSGLDYGLGSYLTLIVVILSSVIFSLSFYRRANEHFLLTSFQRALAHTASKYDCLRTFCDFLITLFGSHGCLVFDSNDFSEMIRDGKSFSIKSSDGLMSLLRRQASSVSPEAGLVPARMLHWLPREYNISDSRFGVFFVDHGLLIGLPDRMTAFEQPVETYYVFVPIKGLRSVSMISNELLNIRSLAQQAIHRIEIFRRCEWDEEYKGRIRSREDKQDYELSTLVHDTNNTVQDIAVLCDSGVEFADSGDSQQAKSIFEKLSSTARMAAAVVSDVKRRREIETSEDISASESVEISNLLKKVYEFAVLRSERRKIKIEFECLGKVLEDHSFTEGLSQIGVRISAEEHLGTILRGMVSNAISYSKTGSTVRLVVREDEDSIYIDVCDSGPGFSKQELKLVFSKWKSKGRWSGQDSDHGLFLCKWFAEKMDGELQVASAGAGMGTTFTLKLQKTEVKSFNRKSSDEPWMLIVEDEEILTVMYSRIAKALHLEPVVSMNFSEARDSLENRPPPTFVLTDLNVEEGDGIDWVNSLRESLGQSVPILVVSGLSGDGIENRALDAGANDYLVKPVGQRTLFSKIQERI